MDKSPDAFRTISEVSEHIDTPAHVLRFWESRFPQIRPVKRAGGRRYYRPSDVALLMGIKQLLHGEGLTIRGVQKLLREQGVRHVASLSGLPDLGDTDDHAESALEAALRANYGEKGGVGRANQPSPTAEIVDLHEAKLTRKFDEFDQSDAFAVTDVDTALDDDAVLSGDAVLSSIGETDPDDSFAPTEVISVDADFAIPDTEPALSAQQTTASVDHEASAASPAPELPTPLVQPATISKVPSVADLIEICALQPRHALTQNAGDIAPVLRQLSALAQKMAAAPEYPLP